MMKIYSMLLFSELSCSSVSANAFDFIFGFSTGHVGTTTVTALLNGSVILVVVASS